MERLGESGHENTQSQPRRVRRINNVPRENVSVWAAKVSDIHDRDLYRASLSIP